jgi:hypothetical protein
MQSQDCSRQRGQHNADDYGQEDEEQNAGIEHLQNEIYWTLRRSYFDIENPRRRPTQDRSDEKQLHQHYGDRGQEVPVKERCV